MNLDESELAKHLNVSRYLSQEYEYQYAFENNADVLELMQILIRVQESLSFDSLRFLNSLHPKLVGNVFVMGERMQVSNYVRYLTIEILGCFYKNHFKTFTVDRDGLLSNEDEDQKDSNQYNIKSMTKPVSLQVFACILIAQKLLDQPILTSYVEDTIAALQLNFTKRQVVKCELRILKDVGFKLPTRSLANCLELLIYLTQLVCEDTDGPRFFSYAFDLLDLTYFHFDKVYRAVHDIISRNECNTSSAAFLLLCGVAAASAITSPMYNDEKVSTIKRQKVALFHTNLVYFSTT